LYEKHLGKERKKEKRSDLPIEIKKKHDKRRQTVDERERGKSLFDNIVKKAYSNFSGIHSYLLNEKKKRRRKREIRKKALKRSSATRVIRLPLTRTSRLSCPNELSSTTSYSDIKKKKIHEPLISL
jgi:Fe-S cluster biosynthesis and repair protein YggX